MEQESNYFTDRFAELETSLINAKAKFKADVRSIRGYYFIIGIGSVFLVSYYTGVLFLPIWLIIIIWAIFIFLILAAFGTDTEKSKSEVEKLEAIKRIYLGFPVPSERGS